MTTSPTPVVLALCAGLALTGLVGCTNKDKDGAQAGASTSPAATKATVTAPPLPKEPTFAEKTPAGAVSDVKIVDCPLEVGEQTVKLELTNSTKKARDYEVLVIWLKNDSGTPLGSTLVTHKAAAPGKKVELTAKGKVVEKSDKCVLKVLAGTLK